MTKRIATTISVTELFRMFPHEDACYAWFEAARWHGQPVCPHCGGIEYNTQPPSKPHHYWHKDCRKQFTVTTKTCMHATKRPLQDWIYAIYSVLTARKGVSAMQLSKELGVQYRTAWHMLQRIREACRKGDFKLSNVVEADETYIGGRASNKHESKKLHAGRGTVGKTAVAGIRERGGKGIAKPVDRTDGATLKAFIKDHIEPGATVYKDDTSAYKGLPTIFNRYTHETVNHSVGEYVRHKTHVYGVESVSGLLKRSIHGTWHHVSPKHLGHYVNEAAFRLNGGNCEVDIIDRMVSFARQVHGKLIQDNGLSTEVVKV